MVFFECRVFDKNGKLTKTHSAKEVQKLFEKTYINILGPAERKVILTFGRGESKRTLMGGGGV